MRLSSVFLLMFTVVLAGGAYTGVALSKSHQSGDQILASTNWQGTTVTDAAKRDVTQWNTGFIGLAKYDATTNHYEFFDKQTQKSRDDAGVYFVTQDGQKRVLVSQTKNYNAVVDLTTLSPELFVYERMGKTGENADGRVAVAHVPYTGALAFTAETPKIPAATERIHTNMPGRDILAATVWQGTVVLDAEGKDVSASNQNFLGLALYDAKNNKYEFFDKTSGVSRGDHGYFDVIRNNTVRVHVSLGMKYAAVLEITELHPKKFTYARKGKDAAGKEIAIVVEHVPYTGALKPVFSF